ncbi:MAG: hypothetical protein ACU843_12655 [Gammaproteobacteria bacterium]
MTETEKEQKPVQDNSWMFVDEALIRGVVTLGDDREHEFFFVEPTSRQMERYREMSFSESLPTGREDGLAYLIAGCLRNPDGSTAMNAQQAGKLKPKIADAFSREILTKCGYLKKTDLGIGDQPAVPNADAAQTGEEGKE